MELIQERQRRRLKALSRMTDDLAWLIGQPAGRVGWTGTQRGLVEMVHLVWQQRRLVDTQGCPYTQAQLAREAFAAVGRRVPGSLTRIVGDLAERVSDDCSMLSRYERLDGEDNILNHFITYNTL